MSSVTLTYFDYRGFAELPRLLLTAAGVKFTDDRITYFKNADGTENRGDWNERKGDSSKYPYHQVPVLNVDGQAYSQSNSIVRYIARHYGLEGSNASEAAIVDGVYETLLDIRKGFFTARGDATKVAAYWNSFVPLLSGLNENIKGPFFLGSKWTYADIALYYSFFVLGTENKEAVDKALAAYPKIKAIFTAVETNEKIAAYLAARKPTPF